MTIKHTITGVLAAGAIYAAMAVPALAATDVTVSDNGFWSDNVVFVKKTNTHFVNQSNFTNVSNFVGTSQNTGHNSTSFNVGGDSTVDSGNATTTVSITNEGSVNLNTDDCECPEGDTDVTVEDNNAFSDNFVVVKESNFKFVSQSNKTNFFNSVRTRQNTGWNRTGWNVGGSTSADSGNAEVEVDIVNGGSGNSN